MKTVDLKAPNAAAIDRGRRASRKVQRVARRRPLLGRRTCISSNRQPQSAREHTRAMKHQLSKTVRFISLSAASSPCVIRDSQYHILNPSILHVMLTNSLVIDRMCASRRHIQPRPSAPVSCVLVVHMLRTYPRCAGSRDTGTLNISQLRGSTS